MLKITKKLAFAFVFLFIIIVTGSVANAGIEGLRNAQIVMSTNSYLTKTGSTAWNPGGAADQKDYWSIDATQVADVFQFKTCVCDWRDQTYMKSYSAYFPTGVSWLDPKQGCWYKKRYDLYTGRTTCDHQDLSVTYCDSGRAYERFSCIYYCNTLNSYGRVIWANVGGSNVDILCWDTDNFKASSQNTGKVFYFAKKSHYYDFLSNGQSWIACDAYNYNANEVTGPDGMRYTNNVIVIANAGSGDHQYMCFQNTNNVGSWAECCGPGTGWDNCYTSGGDGVKKHTGENVGAYYCKSDKTFCTDNSATVPSINVGDRGAGVNFVITASCSDDCSGCKTTKICYTPQGGTETCEITNSKTLSGGAWTARVDSTDNAGKTASTTTQSIPAMAAPTVSVSHSPASPKSNEQVTFSLSASDTDSYGLSWRIYVNNNILPGSAMGIASPVKGLSSGTQTSQGGPYSEGPYTYYATAIDGEGNTARDPATGTKPFTVISPISLAFNSEKYLGDICASPYSGGTWAGSKIPFTGGPYAGGWSTLTDVCHGTRYSSSSGDWYPTATKTTGPFGGGCSIGSRYSCHQEFPTEASSQISNFEIGYTAPGTSCILLTKSSTGSWANRGGTCGVNQTATITVGTSGYCNAVGRCDVKITAGSEITRYYNIPYICGDSSCTSAGGENCGNCPGDCPASQPTCSNSNQWGTCTASSVCSGGAWTCSAQTPSQEVCDGVDNNCANGIDEGLAGTYYRDADSDGYGNPSQSTTSCSQPSGYVANNQDCNDGNANIKPPTNRETAAAGLCSNNIDDDCDGLIDLVSGKIDPGCDTTPPDVTINSPASGSTQTTDFNVGFSASDAQSGLSSCKLYTKDGAAGWVDRGGSCSGTATVTAGAGKYCSSQGANACGVRIWASNGAGNSNQADRYFSIDYSGPTIGVSALAYNPGEWTAKENVSFTITCSDISNCAKLDYSYYNYNYTTKQYNYTANKFLFAKSISGSITSVYDNATCSPGETCRTKLSITATDSLGNTNTKIFEEFKLDLQAPNIEKTDCTYLLKGTHGNFVSTKCSAVSETTPIFVGSNVTLSAFANDSFKVDGSLVKNISIYIKNESGSEMLMKTFLADPSTIRKNGTTTALVKQIGYYTYKIVAEDYAGNKNEFIAGSFRIGGNKDATCKDQGGDFCKDYQVCAGSIEPSLGTDENIGKYCCVPSGNCLNRSNLAACKSQNGVIFDPITSVCATGMIVPASDTVEKNKCCRGTAESTQQIVAWYDIAGNKLSGAARGDRVKCIGTSNTAGKYNMTITLGSRIMNQTKGIPVDKSKKVELSITLNEIGTYKCEGLFY